MSEIGNGGTGVTNFLRSAVYVSQDDEDLAAIRRCLEGDGSAFEPVVVRYQRVLFTVAVRILGNRDDANDAAQNAFVKAYEKLATFDANRRFFSWLYRILVNECINLRRKRHRHEDVGDHESYLAGPASPADVVERRETRVRVQAAVLALPMQYREVVVLRHFAGLSYDEIADALGVPASVVKSRLFTARQRLAQRLLGTEQHV